MKKEQTSEARHTPPHCIVSFDGRGINGDDEYKTRIATFTTAEIASIYGDHFARAINAHDELVHAVKFAKNVIDNACGQLSGDEAKRIHSMMVKAIIKSEETI